MSRVVGIDPSLTKTGIGVIDDTGQARGVLVVHQRPVPKAKRGKLGLPETPTLTERSECLRDAARQVAIEAEGADLVVIYDPPAGAGAMGAARLDMPAYWWALTAGLIGAEIPVARLMDVSARKAITGKGRHGGREADKVATALAVAKLYPAVEIVSDDVADALAAAHLGAVALGWQVPALARHYDVKWSEWPTLPDPSADGRDVHEPGTVGGNVAS